MEAQSNGSSIEAMLKRVEYCVFFYCLSIPYIEESIRMIEPEMVYKTTALGIKARLKLLPLCWLIHTWTQVLYVCIYTFNASVTSVNQDSYHLPIASMCLLSLLFCVLNRSKFDVAGLTVQTF